VDVPICPPKGCVEQPARAETSHGCRCEVYGWIILVHASHAASHMTDPGAHKLNLDAYLSRIAHGGSCATTIETLRQLHLAHVTSIPFENVNVQLGLPVRLDLLSLENKIVGERRGGYCFEQNGLFSAVLEQLGFEVTRLAARVRFGSSSIMARTHMLLLVQCDGTLWIADVGFGGWSLLEPIPLVAERDVQQGSWTMRLRRGDGSWVLQCVQCPAGPDLYAFTLEPQYPIDYEPANHYCATHPNSRFVQTFTVQLPGLDVRAIVRGRELSLAHADATHTTGLSNEELFAELDTRFGLPLSPGLCRELSEKLPV